jgi:hypothetical protein
VQGDFSHSNPGSNLNRAIFLTWKFNCTLYNAQGLPS